MTCLHTAGTCLMCMMILDLPEVHDHHGPLKMPCRTTTKQLTLHPRDVDHDGTAHHVTPPHVHTCTARSLAHLQQTLVLPIGMHVCMHTCHTWPYCTLQHTHGFNHPDHDRSPSALVLVHFPKTKQPSRFFHLSF